MANEVTVPAFKTKLGSSPAKMVLISLADQANARGYSFPSIFHIIDRTELNERTIQRVIQIFQTMGLVKKVKAPPDTSLHHAYQINLDMLGLDLREQFKKLHDEAQGKAKPAVVSETPTPSPVSASVSPSVSETEPPHPHIGGTVTEPSPNSSGELFELPPKKPVRGKAKEPVVLDGSAERAVPDTMWHRLIAEINRLYELANPGIDCPWTPLAFTRLRKLLDSHKTWAEEVWMKCIRHRFASDNINEGEPPEAFIPQLNRFVKGPLNEFNRTKKGDGDASNRSSSKSGGTIDAGRRYLESLEDRQDFGADGDS